MVYLNTTHQIKKDSWQNINICGFKSHITANFARREGLRAAQTLMALASTIFIVDPCIDIWGWSEGQGEQFGTHLGLLGTSGRYGYFWLHIWAGRGSEPVWRRCPETPPKVRAIHGATSSGPNSELIKALKKVCPSPLNHGGPNWIKLRLQAFYAHTGY